MTGLGPSWGRRSFLALLGASPLVLLAAAPEALPRRKAKFSYTNREIKIRIALPDILPANDRHAMKTLDGGYPTRLVYDLGVYAKGARAPMSAVHVEVSVQWDPWNQDYIVQTTVGAGGKPSVRRYALRADAIKASTSLSVPIVDTPGFPRGEHEVHYVHVIAQRNPIQSKTGGGTAAARGQDRDLEMFSRWVGMFVRSRPKAEQTLEFRTHPFYVPED